MSRSADTPLDLPRPPDLSAGGAAELSRLLGGLDQLARVLALPDGPGPDGSVRLGPYRLRRRVGEGRFGVVLLADDLRLGRSVVVKVPQPAVLADPQILARFVREARAAARLDHPGVVPVFEAGEENGLAYLAAGYIDGPTLEEWLRSRPGPVDPPVAARVARALAEAVHHAHERGVLHCDLKPANILLDQSGKTPGGVPGVGTPRVTDFGLARLLEDDPGLTRTMSVAGTALYMAPEQARGDRRNLTARADIYALGAILYELLTGRPPFAGCSGVEVMARLVAEPVTPPRRLNRSVPRDLEAVCLRCLEKDPGRRYASADALAADLGRFLAGRPTEARPVGAVGLAWRTVRRRPVVAVLTAIAAAAVCAVPAVAVGYSLRLEEEAVARRRAEHDADRDRELADTGEFFAALERVRVRRLEQPPGWADDNLADLRSLAGLPPAGRHLPDLRSEAAAALAAVDLRPVRTLAEGFKAYAPAYSPDGSKLALGGWQTRSDGTGVVKLHDPVTGQPLRELTFPIDPRWAGRADTIDGCRAVAFSPNGRWLVAGTRGGQLARWDLSAADPEPVVWTAHADDHPDPRRVWVLALAFAADGGTLYSSCRDSTRAWDVRADWEPTGPKRDHVMPGGTPVRGDGYVAMRTGQDAPPGLCRFDPDGGPARPTGVVGSAIFAVTQDARLAAVIVWPGNALSLAATEPGARPWPLRATGRVESLDINHVGFAPDGVLLATTEEHERRVKLWDVADGGLVADRAVSGGSVRFAFAPGGRHLAVTEDDKTVVYEVTGRARETLAAGPRWQARPVAVRPDGRALAVLHNDLVGHLELSTWDVTPDRPPVLLARRDVARPGNRTPVADFAPDGSGFAFTTDFAATDQAGEGDRVEYSDGTAVACEGVSDLRFAPDGRLWAADAHRVRVWTLPGWREERPLENEAAARDAGAVFRAVAPGKRLAAVGRRDGRVFLLPAAGPAPPPRPVFNSAVTSLALSPDEDRVLAGGERGEVIVLSVTDGGITVLPDAHRDAVQSVAYGPGGWFATGSADRTVKLWDAAGQLVLTLRAGAGVRKVAVSTDGHLLTVLIDGERAVRRWRLDRLGAALADLGMAVGLPVADDTRSRGR